MLSSRTKGGAWAAFFAVSITAALILFLPNLIQFFTPKNDEFQPIKFSGDTYPLVVTDSLGAVTRLDHPPRRIIASHPA
ncbi:hypothetical protein QQ056_03030 [Oscillatoria laete-virens NRMC-F 0139]|nr:hypothetical protein [Oscillatoria laete-virens]MDL5052536.1 hypothetical protein [Oscillatoria laete-virens NRMC-F 0139]